MCYWGGLGAQCYILRWELFTWTCSLHKPGDLRQRAASLQHLTMCLLCGSLAGQTSASSCPTHTHTHAHTLLHPARQPELTLIKTWQSGWLTRPIQKIPSAHPFTFNMLLLYCLSHFASIKTKFIWSLANIGEQTTGPKHWGRLAWRYKTMLR